MPRAVTSAITRVVAWFQTAPMTEVSIAHDLIRDTIRRRNAAAAEDVKAKQVAARKKKRPGSKPPVNEAKPLVPAKLPPVSTDVSDQRTGVSPPVTGKVSRPRPPARRPPQDVALPLAPDFDGVDAPPEVR